MVDDGLAHNRRSAAAGGPRLLLVLSLAGLMTACPRIQQPASPPPAPTRPTIQRPAPPEPHADYQQLRRFRNYYRVIDVGEYRHHFVAFYHDSELVTATYQAAVTPTAPATRTGDSFGLVTTRPTHTPVPAAVRPLAETIADEIGAKRSPQVEYLGSYREVRVQEIVVGETGGYPPGTRQFQETLAISEDFTQIRGPATYAFDMGGSLRLDDVADHYDQTHWVDARVGQQGRPQLYRLLSGSLAFDATTRGMFGVAVLAAAQRLADGAPSVALADLEAHQDPQVLPSDLEVRRAFTFYVNARKTSGMEQPQAKVWFDTPDLFVGSEQRIEMALQVPSTGGRVSFDARLRLRAPAIPDGAAGEIVVPVDVWFEVVTRARRRPVDTHRGHLKVDARVMVDEDRTLVLELTPPIPVHVVPGVEPYREFEIHLGAWGGD